MRRLIPLNILLSLSIALAQSGGSFNYIKLFPTSLPVRCSIGDIRTDTATNIVNYCSSTNTWTKVGTAYTNQTGSAGTYYPLFVSSSSNGLQSANLSTGFSLNPSTDIVTATSFSGSLLGNATSATSAGSATNATNVGTTQNSSNATYYPLFVSSNSNGFQPTNLASGFTINPSSDVVTATTFSGALSGNATTATTATTATNANNIATTRVSNSATYYPVIVPSSTNSNQAPDLSTGLTFNPSTDVLTTTTFSGALSGNATNVSGIVAMANGGTSANLTPAGGDIVYTNGSAMALLANGSSGQVLSSQGTTLVPKWITNSPSFSGLTTNGVAYASNTTTLATTAAGTAGDVLTSNGSGSPPTYQTAQLALSYSQAYFDASYSWQAQNTGAFADLTNTAVGTFTVRNSNGITLTAAGSNLAGITFTPSSASAVYFIFVTFSPRSTPGVDVGYQLTDGTNVFCDTPYFINNDPGTSIYVPVTMGGIYVPGAATAKTVKITAKSNSTPIGPTAGYGQALEWSIIQIK